MITIIRTLHNLREGCENLWLFFEAKSGPLAKNLGTTVAWRLCNTNHRPVDGYFVHYTTRIICRGYTSSKGMNVASFELCRKGKEVTPGGAEEACKRPRNVRVSGPKFEPVSTNIRSRSCIY